MISVNGNSAAAAPPPSTKGRRSSKADAGCSSASNGGRKFRYCRDKSTRPEALYEFLAKKFAYLSEQGWKELIVNGRTIDPAVVGVSDAALATTPHVLVNSAICADPLYILQQQDLIGFVTPATLEPEVDEKFTVLYEDPHLIAVSKSGNIPVCTGGRYRHNTLERVVHSYMAGRVGSSSTDGGGCDVGEGGGGGLGREGGAVVPSIYPVHRLDKETSGVTVFAKTKAVSQRLALLFGSKDDHYDATLQNQQQPTSTSDALLVEDSSICNSSDEVLVLQLTPFASLHVGWHHASHPPGIHPSTTALHQQLGNKRDRAAEVDPTTTSVPPSTTTTLVSSSNTAVVPLHLKKEYSALVHMPLTLPSGDDGSKLLSSTPFDVRYRIGFAGESEASSAVSVVVEDDSAPLLPTPNATTSSDAPLGDIVPTGELSRKELKRRMWQLRNKKGNSGAAEGVDVRSEMAEGSLAMVVSQGITGGASSLQELHRPTTTTSPSTTLGSSKFLNSMAMKCFPEADTTRGKHAHTRILSICPSTTIIATSSAATSSTSPPLFASVHCQIFTGRTHQIRCHLAAIGLPIVGDKLYASATPPPTSSDTTTGTTAIATAPALGNDAVVPLLPCDQPETEQRFFAKCRGSLSVDACDGFSASRHCLHAAKVTVPLGLLLGQYSSVAADDLHGQGDRTASSSAVVAAHLEALLASFNRQPSSFSSTSADALVQNLKSFLAKGEGRGPDSIVAALVLDASSLSSFEDVIVPNTK